MITFQVDDMTCGHCVSMITKAVRDADKKATVNIDLASHRVEHDAAGEKQERHDEEQNRRPRDQRSPIAAGKLLMVVYSHGNSDPGC